MINQTFKATSILLVCFALLSVGTAAFAYQNPIVNAGPDLYVNSGQTVTLQGSAYDAQGSSLIYYWNCDGGSLSNPNTPQATFTASNPYNNYNNYSGQTTYTCSLTATDTFNLSSSAATTIFVNYNNGNNNNGSYNVVTGGATYISNFQATLNGNLSITNTNGSNYNSNYIYFQWGTTTDYGNETPQQILGYSEQFLQNIENLNPGTTYHYRAVSKGSYGTIYGQDMTFTTSGAGNGAVVNYNGTGTLSVTKQVINLTSGNLNWQASVNGNPGDILSFAITIQSNANHDIHNVFVRDILPANLIYKGNLTVNAALNSSGNPQNGINIGTISSGGIQVITYQAQVASTANIPAGTSTASNSATITSTEGGTQTAAASVIINNPLVLGAATTVSTGLTNNPVTDSFFLPVMLIILGSYLYFSGKIYVFADWLEEKIK